MGLCPACTVGLRCSGESQHCSPGSCSSQKRGEGIRGEGSWAGDQQLPRCCCSFPQNCPGERRRHSLWFVGDYQTPPLVLQRCSCLMCGLCLETITLLLSSSHSEAMLPSTCTLPDLGIQVSEGISMGSICRAGGALFLAAVPWAVQLQLGLVGPWQHRSCTSRNESQIKTDALWMGFVSFVTLGVV